MTDSDFTIGFKQGQEHGIQIMQEKIEEIKAEIESLYPKYTLAEIRICDKCLEIINNHIGEVSE